MKLRTITTALLFVFTANFASAHCQVPCGIFNDELKFSELEQHVETIAKAARLMNEISAKDDSVAYDQQQFVRWTKTKEEHAQKIIDEAANYFLAQRIKTDADHYAEKIELLHHIMVKAMKTKQSTEAEASKVLLEKIEAFEKLYLDHKH
ncbi:MAG: superoxide dismutase [Ni] [Verrucomicrobiota bacterium]